MFVYTRSKRSHTVCICTRASYFSHQYGVYECVRTFLVRFLLSWHPYIHNGGKKFLAGLSVTQIDFDYAPFSTRIVRIDVCKIIHIAAQSLLQVGKFLKCPISVLTLLTVIISTDFMQEKSPRTVLEGLLFVFLNLETFLGRPFSTLLEKRSVQTSCIKVFSKIPYSLCLLYKISLEAHMKNDQRQAASMCILPYIPTDFFVFMYVYIYFDQNFITLVTYFYHLNSIFQTCSFRIYAVKKKDT